MFHVSDVAVGQKDAAGVPITFVYAKRPPDYAVYRTAERVGVLFADDPTLEKTQRTALVKLNPLRSAIASLIEDWRVAEGKEVFSKVERFDARVADALIAALEGDSDGAIAQLQKTKDDIVDERTSKARFQYLIMAAGSCAACIILSWILSRQFIWRDIVHFQAAYVSSLWLAAATGSVGAFFSIAIAIRSRTILTDLRTRDNFSDAILRIFIGAIAGAVLIGLLLTDLVTFSIGDKKFEVVPPRVGSSELAGGTLTNTATASQTAATTTPNTTAASTNTATATPDATAASANTADTSKKPAKPSPPTDWLMLMLAAFIAGFFERLVPDMLAKAVADPVKKPSPTTAATEPAAASVVTPPAAPGSGGAAPEPDAEVDHCAATAGITDSEATPDSRLPPATGGVVSATNS